MNSTSAKKSARKMQGGNKPDGEQPQLTVVEDAAAPPSPAAASARRGRRKSADPVHDIDPRYLANEDEMQYALLLALLLKHNGAVRLSAADLEVTDTDYNIVFARTRDGRFLEVTAVSAQSGIIRSPEKRKEAQQWNAAKQQAAAEQPAPTWQPLPPLTAVDQPAEAQQIFPMTEFVPRRNPVPPIEGNGVAGAANPSTPNPTATKDGSSPYQFPFEVGSTPSTAKTMDLTVAQRRLLEKDQQIAVEQQTAAARVEEQG